MGLFDFLRKQSHGPYVPEDEYLKNLDNQTKMSPRTLEQLRELGIDESKQLRLEYFFYTNTREKAESLGNELHERGYSVEVCQSAGNKKNSYITGWTNAIRMTDEDVVNWTKEMCEIGFKYDCQFDGWGTAPDQSDVP